jgi:polysaccharide transporter, PST family
MDKVFWRGTLILTLSAFIIKILSAVYRLPYQNLAGDIGFYVYQQVYPFYALAAVMAGFGFPVVLSKIIAEVHQDHEEKKQSAFKTALILLGTIGIILFSILFMGAPFIANVMGDPKLEGPIQIISFIFLFMPFLASLRGYFQGAFYNMLPTGVSQVVEQAIRVSTILGLSLFLFSHHAGPYAFGSAAAFGSMIAPAFSAGVLIIFYFKWKKRRNPDVVGRWDKTVAIRLLIEGTAYTLTALSIVFFQLSDGLTLVPLLESHHDVAGKALKGVYDRSYPLIQMGLTAAVAMATAIIPMVAKFRETQNTVELKTHIGQALKVSILFGGAASVGLFAIIKETNMMLFENEKGTTALAIMTFCILAASIVITGASILQGVGHTFRPVIYIAIAFVVKTALNFILIPTYGINGAATASLIGLSILAFLIYRKLSLLYGISALNIKEWVKLIAIFIVLLVGVTLWRMAVINCLMPGNEGRMEAALVALTSAFIGAVLFLTCIMKLGLLSWKEVEQLPGGQKISAFFNKRS